MTELEVEGKTVQDAIAEGLKKLNCAKEKVDIKILNEGTSGLFGLMGSKPARVMLTIKDLANAFEHINVEKTKEKAKTVTADILKLMGMDCKEVKTSLLADRVLVEVKSNDSRFIIGKGGATLDALEHVINLILHQNEETRAKINLDTEGYRAQQESRLQTLALKAAAQVKNTGKSYRFDPMSSKERRLVHLFLKNNSDVEAFSEGEGNFRKVVVKPKKK